jgi:SAM-dependent methyltransferase
MKSRKQYMKNTYAKYWINARGSLYGFTPYDKSLVTKIDKVATSISAEKILEVAIGTGEPIARSLSEKGYRISGIDISDILVKECQDKNPEIQCEIGDAENLHFSDGSFDMTYCLHSSWFVTNFNKAISEMIRVTRVGGVVIFDIQNIFNGTIKSIYKQHLFENTNIFGMIYKAVKNSVKFILQRGTQDWPFIVSQTPLNPSLIYKLLSDLNVEKIEIFGHTNNKIQDLGSANLDYSDHSRLIFIAHKNYSE